MSGSPGAAACARSRRCCSRTEVLRSWMKDILQNGSSWIGWNGQLGRSRRQPAAESRGASQVLSIKCNEGVRSSSPLNGMRAGVRGGNHKARWSCRTLGITTPHPHSLSPLRGEGRRKRTALNSVRHSGRVETEMRPMRFLTGPMGRRSHAAWQRSDVVLSPADFRWRVRLLAV